MIPVAMYQPLLATGYYTLITPVEVIKQSSKSFDIDLPEVSRKKYEKKFGELIVEAFNLIDGSSVEYQARFSVKGNKEGKETGQNINLSNLAIDFLVTTRVSIIAIEIDEKHHNSQETQDALREFFLYHILLTCPNPKAIKMIIRVSYEADPETFIENLMECVVLGRQSTINRCIIHKLGVEHREINYQPCFLSP
jgi:hypothetical protein